VSDGAPAATKIKELAAVPFLHIITGMSMANRSDYRDFYSGLIRLHVLHHAVEEPIFGLGMIDELRRHGYQISPGTLYPLLHGLEKKRYLKATDVRSGKSLRKVYRATPLGRKALALAKEKVRELFRELIEGK
jgi:DNA-binding PadR family transcriptional regulator